VDIDRFHHLMGVQAGTILIVTTRAGDGERSGCLVGFATQCSIDPARYLVCLSDKNHTYRVAQRAELLGVHVLPAARHDLAELFGALTGDDVDKLALVPWREGAGGVPLVDGCPDWFVGRIRDRVPFGDHVGHVLDIEAVSGHPPGSDVLHLPDVADVEPGHEP
jgi:flavin reductase (DIM6/NTAB) family NADH-FMN oxidoreductase RutF